MRLIVIATIFLCLLIGPGSAQTYSRIKQHVREYDEVAESVERVLEYLPTNTVSYASELAAHETATNPHSITPALIGAGSTAEVAAVASDLASHEISTNAHEAAVARMLVAVVRAANSQSIAATYTPTTYIFDTDSAACTAALPAGAQDYTYRFVNAGTQTNNLLVTGSGAETVRGSTNALILFDGESAPLSYDETES